MGSLRLSGPVIGLLAGLMFCGIAQAETIVATPAEQQQVDFLKQDEAWFIAHLKGPRETADGATLDARLQYVLENVTRPASTSQVQGALRAMYKTPEGLAAVRTQLDRYWALRTKDTSDVHEFMSQNFERPNGGILTLKIFKPLNLKVKNSPVLIYFHGGGFMFGSIDGFERTVKLIAKGANIAVITVGYRLAPEHPYPAAWDDAEEAYDEAIQFAKSKRMGMDSTRIAIGGDSAGATLAIATALRAKKAGKPMPKALLLYYPGVDRVNGYPSMDKFGKGYGLDAENLEYLAKQVYPDGVKTTSEDTSPIQADLKGLPPTFVVMAGFDPLKDGQKAFADKLQASGVKTTHMLYPTLIHGFLQTSAYVPDAEAAATETAKAFGEAMRAK